VTAGGINTKTDKELKKHYATSTTSSERRAKKPKMRNKSGIRLRELIMGMVDFLSRNKVKKQNKKKKQA